MRWGVVSPAHSFAVVFFATAPVHPSQINFSGAGLALSALGWSLLTRGPTPGVLFWLFIALFGLTRIPLDLTRAYEAEAQVAHIGGWTLTESQVMSFTMALFAALMILRIRRSSRPAA
jgi:prolipoprotein diacylglyceryltransferase